jgi:cytochrome c oxidase subunit II
MTTSSKPAAAQARTVVVTADNWTFSPSVIRIKKGETVSLQLKGEEGVHGIMVPGLNINQKIDLGQTVTVAVATDVAGTYDFFCNVPCGPGHKQMKGQIIIE